MTVCRERMHLCCREHVQQPSLPFMSARPRALGGWKGGGIFFFAKMIMMILEHGYVHAATACSLHVGGKSESSWMWAFVRFPRGVCVCVCVRACTRACARARVFQFVSAIALYIDPSSFYFFFFLSRNAYHLVLLPTCLRLYIILACKYISLLVCLATSLSGSEFICLLTVKGAGDVHQDLDRNKTSHFSLSSYSIFLFYCNFFFPV